VSELEFLTKFRETRKIKVNSLVDIRDLLRELENPGDLYLPLKAFNCIYERTQPSTKRADEKGQYILFESTRLRPPKFNSCIIDLSNAELIDA